jgi:hypothetical protein
MDTNVYQARTAVKLLDDLVSAMEREGKGRLVRFGGSLTATATHLRLVLDGDDAVEHLAHRLGWEPRQGRRGARAFGRWLGGTLALSVAPEARR